MPEDGTPPVRATKFPKKNASPTLYRPTGRAKETGCNIGFFCNKRHTRGDRRKQGLRFKSDEARTI